MSFRPALLLPALLLGGCLHAASVTPQTPPAGERLITPTVPTVQATIEVFPVLTDRFDRSLWRFVQIDRLKIHDEQARLQFQEGTLAGHTGCNRLSGTYSREGNRLTLDRVALTRMFCAGKAEQENRITDVLARTRSAAVVKANGFLLLLDANREMLAELAPVNP